MATYTLSGGVANSGSFGASSRNRVPIIKIDFGDTEVFPTGVVNGDVIELVESDGNLFCSRAITVIKEALVGPTACTAHIGSTDADGFDASIDLLAAEGTAYVTTNADAYGTSNGALFADGAVIKMTIATADATITAGVVHVALDCIDFTKA